MSRTLMQDLLGIMGVDINYLHMEVVYDDAHFKLIKCIEEMKSYLQKSNSPVNKITHNVALELVADLPYTFSQVFPVTHNVLTQDLLFGEIPVWQISCYQHLFDCLEQEWELIIDERKQKSSQKISIGEFENTAETLEEFQWVEKKEEDSLIKLSTEIPKIQRKRT